MFSVDAVAGSGKTTTILHIAQKFEDKHICCITYNAKLKNETHGKITSLCILYYQLKSLYISWIL